MTEGEDGGSRSRDSHYNQQRSSWRSESSARTRSRPQSQRTNGAQVFAGFDDYTLQDAGEEPYAHSPTTSTPSSPSPAPNVPRVPTRHGSIDKKRRTRAGSRSGSHRGHSSRSNSRGKAIEEVLFPSTWDGLDELESPPPIQNPDERNVYRHRTREAERGDSRDSRRRQRSRLSSYPPSQRQRPSNAVLAGPGQLPGSTLDITALPDLSDSRPIPGHSAHSRVLTELYTVSYLILLSILGTLARLGLQWLTYYPGAPVTFSELWANVAGTLVMGFLSQDRKLFREEWGNVPYTPPRTPRPGDRGNDNDNINDDEEKGPSPPPLPRNEAAIRAYKANHNKVKKTIPLYIGLATGFCGSFTSFSSFIRDTFLAFVNDLPNPDRAQPIPRNDGYSFMAGLAVLFLTISLCYTALKVGAHLAILAQPVTPTLPFRLTRRLLDPIVVFVAWSAWLGALFMAIWPPDRPNGPASRGPSWAQESWRGDAIFACLFAPAGCLLRFYFSLVLNPFIPSFPLGTFAVNIFGTAVLGMAYDVQHVAVGTHGVGGGRVGCQVLQGVMDGFCGALTTVSTWILEIDGSKRRNAYVYAAGSVWTAVLVLVVVMGSVKWTVGWEAVACTH